MFASSFNKSQKFSWQDQESDHVSEKAGNEPTLQVTQDKLSLDLTSHISVQILHPATSVTGIIIVPLFQYTVWYL